MRLLSNSTDWAIVELRERIERLEERIFKTARKKDTPARLQLLLFHHLGLLDRINELNLSGVKKAKLLSILLNASDQNIKKDLSQINKKNSELKNSHNYSFLLKTFEDLGMKKQAEDVDKILLGILKEEEK